MYFKGYIDGRWISGNHTEANINPANPSQIVGEWHSATKEDVEAAFLAAKRAEPVWRNTLPGVRAAVLRTVGDELIARSEELGRLLSLEEGKTLREGIGEVRRSGDIFHYYAGECTRAAGEFLPGLREGFSLTVGREPLGVVALITAWNFPMMLPAMKAAAALACGNTVVLKPSEFTPGCACALAEIISCTNLPRGAFNLVIGGGAEIGSLLVSRADGVSFTGSTNVGRIIVEQASRNLVKVQAEMGGKNPLIIANDANVDLAVEVAVQSMYFSTGQRCTATSRLVVLSQIHDQFVEKLLRRTNGLAIGDPLLNSTDMGPVANAGQLQKNLHFIGLAKEEGAELATGGNVIQTVTDGYYLQPTLFLNTHSRMRINQDEVFGPVGAVIKVGDLDEAIAIANDVEFGLSSGICTESLAHAERFRRASKAGMVMINAPTSGADYHVPLGGRGHSGYGGKELGHAGTEFFTESKVTYTNVSGHL